MSENGHDIKPATLTAPRTAAKWPPDRPPARTATQRPDPMPSGSVMCNPCAAPARLGLVEGGQCGFFGSCWGVSKRSYIRTVKSREVVQKR